MADKRRGRARRAPHGDRTQQRAPLLALEHDDETEPPVEAAALDALDAELAELVFPVTGAELVDAVGVRAVADGYTVADLVPVTESDWFRTPQAVRLRLRRPAVAGAMKRIAEAVAETPGVRLNRTHREVYERTFRELKAIAADDAVDTVTDWLVERIRLDEQLPSSRAVRRRAAAFCRANGYPVREDAWLGA